MFRTDFDITDEEFEKVSKPFTDAVDDYLQNNFILDYIAFYLATGFRKSALFKGTLSGVFNAAIDELGDLKFGSDEDIRKLKGILQDKYHLLLTSDTDLEIEEIPTQK